MTEPEQPTADSGAGAAESPLSADDPQSAPIPPGPTQQQSPPNGPQPESPYGAQAQPPYGQGPGPQWQYGPQYGAAPGYPPPYYYGYGYPQPQSGTNGMAIAAMVCGICGFLCLIPGLVGIVLGIVSLPQIKRSGQGGRGMAIAGIVMGTLWIVALILVIVFSHGSSQPIDPSGSSNGTSM